MTLEYVGGLVGSLAAIGVFALIYRWRPLTARKQLTIASIAVVIFLTIVIVGGYFYFTRPHPSGPAPVPTDSN